MAIASGESLDEACFAELNSEEASHNSADYRVVLIDVAVGQATDSSLITEEVVS